MNFLKIALRDISNILRNRFMRISVIAIIIVPLMYSFFYLYAFWDPYSKLSRMPVAVVNLDKGGVSSGKRINYGKDFTNDLKNNHNLGWRFVTKTNAVNGLNGNKYYAAIIIPENFTSKILSAKNGTPQKANITYIANEKKNFLASQINSKVIIELRDQISNNITREYTKITFDNLNDIKDEMKLASNGSKNLTNGLIDAKNGSNLLANNLNSLKDASVNIYSGIEKLYTGSDQLNTGLKNANSSVKGIYPQINSQQQLLSLLDPQNINSSRLLINDACLLKNTDTSALQLLLPVLTPDNINLFNKLIGDYSSIDINSLKNSPLFTLSSTMTRENLQEMTDLLNASSELNTIDTSKIAPLITLAQNSGKINSIMDEAQGLANVDINSMKNFLTEQQTNAQNYINTANILNTPEHVNLLKMAISTNDNLNSQQKTQLTDLINSYYNLTKSTSDSMTKGASAISYISRNLDELTVMQNNLKSNQGLFNTIKTALNPQNMVYLNEQLTKLMQLQGELKKNEQNLSNVQTLLSQLNNPSMQQSMSKINTFINEVSKAQNAINAIKSQLTSQMLLKLSESPQQLEQLIKMQQDLKDNEKLLEVVQNALNDNNLTLARNLIDSMPELINGLDKLYVGSNQLNNGLKKLNYTMPQYIHGINQLNTGVLNLNSGLSKLTTGSGVLSNKLSNGEKQLAGNLKNSSDSMADFIAQPMRVSDKSINLVKNYGTGFTPYFIPLSLWVGGIMMFFIITDETDPDIKTNSINLVLGKFLSYGFIGIMQSVLVSIIVLVLGLRPNNTLLFFIFNIFTSFVYIAIIQSLVFLMGQAGRLLSIVLLILQLTSDAGTFPLELVPKFFKAINPYMPFTYAVSGLREIISGINNTIFAQDIIALIIFLIVFLLISILMKGKTDAIKRKYLREMS